MKKINETWLDRAIGFFSPSLRNQRLIERQKTELLNSRVYDAASSTPQNVLRKSQKSASKEVGSQNHSIRYAVRHQIQNNPLAKRALDVLTTSVVSWGIEASITSSKNQDKIDNLWKHWIKNCSVDGQNFSAVQAQVFQALVTDGEVLIKKNIMLDNSVRIQILEADYLCNNATGIDLKKNEFFENGVIFDEWKRPTKYVLYKHFPNDGKSKEIEVIPANEIIHLFRQDRPQQNRGVSWFAQVLHSLNMVDELQYTQLVRLKLAASITAVVTKQPSTLPIDQQIAEREDEWSLNAGTVQYINAGENIEFPTIPNPEGFEGVSKQTLRQIAVGLGITYEALTGDLSSVNFSSARIGEIQFRQNVEAWRWNLFIPLFMDSVFECFKKYCELNGITSKEINVEWVPAQRILMDPQTEIDSTASAIRNGLMSYQGALRELGLNPKLHVKEISESNKLLDDNNIVLDSDPRKVAGSTGQMQSADSIEAVKK